MPASLETGVRGILDLLRTSDSEENLGLKDILEELDRESVRIIIREETRRFRKPTTLIEGLPKQKKELQRITRELKTKLATGGTFKDGTVILQGDKREAARDALISMGFPPDRIEVQ
ncbi:MAG: stress response translation initiation inhibitor YciH [Nitrososphaerota archaeon]|nr:stress response translation initiation inhibitor YciH [Nitrososphaerota archaeon]